MKIISERRHKSGLKKELNFWKKRNILESQQVRTTRYIESMGDMLGKYGDRNVYHVLDIGCGPSCIGQTIKDGKKWFIDPLLDEYRHLFGQQIPNGVLICGKIEDVALKADFFDIILAFNALDHMRNPWLALKKIHLILKPGGIFLFSLYIRRPLMAFSRNLQEHLGLSTDRAHPYTFAKKRIERDLINNNFSIESTRVLAKEDARSEYMWACKKTDGHDQPRFGKNSREKPGGPSK